MHAIAFVLPANATAAANVAALLTATNGAARNAAILSQLDLACSSVGIPPANFILFNSISVGAVTTPVAAAAAAATAAAGR